MKFDATKMTEKVAKLLETDAYKSFVGADGETYQFTDDEKKLIKERAKELFDEVEEQLLTRTFGVWGALPRDLGAKVSGRVSDDDIVAKMEKQIMAAAKQVIMARDESPETGTRIRGKVDKSLVEVIDFKYEFATRLAAARALADRAGSYPAWSKEARAAIAKELKTLVDSSLNINNFKEFTDAKLSRPLRDWYLEQQRLLRELPK